MHAFDDGAQGSVQLAGIGAKGLREGQLECHATTWSGA